MERYKYDGSKKEASNFVKLSNNFETIRLDVNNNKEFKLSSCGCCSTGGNDVMISGENGDIWNQATYDFLKKDYNIKEHACVNPSLWTNGRNNQINGLFTVLDKKIYQVRGYDMANITFVRTKGETLTTGEFIPAGWLVFDTLMSKECTYAAMELANQYFIEVLGAKEQNKEKYSLVNGIRGIIISHSHVDHFGGMNAVIYYNNGVKCVNDEPRNNEKPELLNHSYEIYVPSGFVQHSASENVYAGNAMARRATYQYGNSIKPSNDYDYSTNTKGSISIGIGQGQSLGTASFSSDVFEIKQNDNICINGLYVKFQLTPGTEAPAEMNNYIPEYQALWLAENCSGTLHNLYTLRGAQVRDGNAWAKYLMEAAELYGSITQVIFQAHNWPHWSQDAIDENGIKTANNLIIPSTDIKEFLIDTASIYKYINDQSLLYMNEGYKMEEVAQKIRIPDKLARNWCLRPYYGTPYHDSKAVYQKYLGFYDANPVHLNPLSAEEGSKKYIEYMGGVQSVLDKAYADYKKGNYRFVAEVTNLILFSGIKDNIIVIDNDGKDTSMSAFDAARYLCADALEQMGYTSESGIWRNAYLSGAYELRNGKGRLTAKTSSDLVLSMDAEMLLDYIGILFDGEKGFQYKFSFTMRIFDGCKEKIFKGCKGEEFDGCKSEVFNIELRHGVLLHYKKENSEENPINDPKADFAICKYSILKLIEEKASPYYNSLKSDLKKYMIREEKPVDDCIDYMIAIMDNITNLKIDRYKVFDIVLPLNSEVEIDDNLNGKVKCNLRDQVVDCAGMFEAYYEYMKERINSDTFVSLNNDDKSRWIYAIDKNIGYGFYNILVLETGVFEDGNFFTPKWANNSSSINAGIGPDCNFNKYEYSHILYECYKFLAEPYMNGAECDDEETVYIKQAITLAEPYVALFRQRKGGAKNTDELPFEDYDMPAWEYLYPKLKLIGIPDSEFFKTDKRDGAGVGIDGKFTGSELLHLLYQLYKYLYEKKNNPIEIKEQKAVV